MNKQNLIRLGSICQKKFDMSDDYKYIELPSDNTKKTFMVPIPTKYEWNSVSRLDFTNILIDEIRLEQIFFNNNYERAWVGYGKASNTLVIQEIDK